ncbi:MAG: hypothetical protein H3Z50_00230 [archaeon]|nr:hypothetical protein [archaeon]
MVLSEQTSPKIEDMMVPLYEMENELDETKAKIKETKNELSSLAQKEAGKSRSEVLEEAKKKTEEDLANIKAEAEKEAEKILAKGNEEIEELKAKIKGVYDKAVEMVLKTLLGE